MKASQHTAEQIIEILEQAEKGDQTIGRSAAHTGLRRIPFIAEGVPGKICSCSYPLQRRAFDFRYHHNPQYNAVAKIVDQRIHEPEVYDDKSHPRALCCVS